MDIKNPLLYIPKYFKVLSKADRKGIADLVPMNLWPIQKHYAENRTHRDWVLKNRQCGFSTGLLALNSHALFVQPYERQTVIAHDDGTAEFLLQTVNRYYLHLPPDKKPYRDWHSGARMRFPAIKPDKSRGLDSFIYVDSAKSDSIGIGRGLTRAHLSELAKYPPRKEAQLFADISQTVPEGGYLTVESTPKGRGGLFFRNYEAAKRHDINYKAFFYPWWWDITCVRAVIEPLKLTEEEAQMVKHYKLTNEQVAFRREKLAELGDLFYQEYAENDIDCWLSSDVSVFDGVAIRRYLQQIEEGRHEGNVTIWQDVKGGEKYVIGADPAGGAERGDWSVAAVLRVRTNQYVARLRAKMPTDLFAQEVMRLGYRYNDAQLGVEKIMHGHSVLKVLMDANYPDIYQHQEYDAFNQKATYAPGWVTSKKSKPVMLNDMAAAIRSGDIIVWSENFLLEASNLMWDGDKTKTPSGGYDDELDALMIALQLRELLPITTTTRQEPISYFKL